MEHEGSLLYLQGPITSSNPDLDKIMPQKLLCYVTSILLKLLCFKVFGVVKSVITREINLVVVVVGGSET